VHPSCQTLDGMKLPGHEFPRIVVVGTSCAGKSTFASCLALAIDCPRIELDNLYWGPGWEPKPQQEFRLLVSEAVAQESWVADGNYGSVRELVWPRASTVVWLNYSFPRVLWQALKRTVARCVSGEILWHGNRESVRRAFFSKKSILVWVATTYHRRKNEFTILRASNKFSHVSWVEVRHPAEARELLASLRDAV
jgi:adenylate kinase family enzyme